MWPIPRTQTKEERSEFPASGPAPFCDAAWSSCGTGPAWPIGWMGNRSRPQRGRLALVRHHYIELATISSLNSSSLIERHVTPMQDTPQRRDGTNVGASYLDASPTKLRTGLQVASNTVRRPDPRRCPRSVHPPLVSRHEKTQTQLLQTGLDRRR